MNDPASPSHRLPAPARRSVLSIGVLLAAALACFYAGWTHLRVPASSPSPSPSFTPASLSVDGPVPSYTTDSLDSLLALYDPFTRDRLPPPDTREVEQWVDSMMAVLTLDEQIGQLLLVDLQERELVGLGSVDEAVSEFHVGGYLIPRLMEPDDVFRETTRLQRLSAVPLFFAADYERGVGRFDNHLTEFPASMGLGATRNPALARAAGLITAIEARATGVNLLFAPVVDVNNNPENPIINIRSYGESAAQVGALAAAYVEGAHGQGVLATLKHFPGHGNTADDSHVDLGIVSGSRASLDSLELLPYRMLLHHSGFDPAVMTAHLWVKAFDRDPVPATVSPAVLQGLLRDTLGFDGLIVTDHIRMDGLSDTYDYAERVVGPIVAGADVVLGPNDLSAAVDAVKQALAAGTLSHSRFSTSVRRVLRAKALLNLHRTTNRTPLNRLLQQPLGEPVARLIASEAITLLRPGQTVPLDAGHRVGLVQLANSRTSRSIRAAMGRFDERLSTHASVSNHALMGRLTRAASAATLAAVDTTDAVVLALYLRVNVGGTLSVSANQEALITRILATGKPVLIAAFGNPYVVDAFPEADGVLIAYDQTLASVEAAADVLTGRLTARGRLPITTGTYPLGSGGAVGTPPAAGYGE